MAKIKTDNTKYWQGYEKTGSLIHCWWECMSTLKYSLPISLKPKHETTTWLKNYIFKNLYKNVYRNFIHDSQKLKTTHMSHQLKLVGD